MHLYFYVRDAQGGEHEVGQLLCPVVPRIGETVYLNMSLNNRHDWRLNPANPGLFSTAYFLVEDVAYEGYNIAELEPNMGAAPYAEGSTADIAQLFVQAKNEDTQVYVDRMIAKALTPPEEPDEN